MEGKDYTGWETTYIVLPSIDIIADLQISYATNSLKRVHVKRHCQILHQQTYDIYKGGSFVIVCM